MSGAGCTHPFWSRGGHMILLPTSPNKTTLYHASTPPGCCSTKMTSHMRSHPPPPAHPFPVVLHSRASGGAIKGRHSPARCSVHLNALWYQSACSTCRSAGVLFALRPPSQLNVQYKPPGHCSRGTLLVRAHCLCNASLTDLRVGCPPHNDHLATPIFGFEILTDSCFCVPQHAMHSREGVPRRLSKYAGWYFQVYVLAHLLRGGILHASIRGLVVHPFKSNTTICAGKGAK